MQPVLSVRDLIVSFDTRGGPIAAVNGVSFDVNKGEILGLVGESGSGKSMTGLALLGLIDPPGRIEGGAIFLEGDNLVGASEDQLRRMRGKRISMIFQDPMTTLNPVLRIDTQIIEAVRAHESLSWTAARDRALEALVQVGIPSPKERLTCYPHQFSGGMRQRIAIAIALLHRPSVLIADEPTTALDVTIQAQILAEVQRLAAEVGTAIIWISHDLSVVAGLADRVAVMYAGRIVESGTVAEVLDRPLHPYTAGLIGSVPSRNKRGTSLAHIAGMAPSALRMPKGCAFRPRCFQAREECLTSPPQSTRGSRTVRCVSPLDDFEMKTPVLDHAAHI
ncbi:MAG: ABC transporter ATP-binding protein [Mesorhizobium sp.]|nr:MAG: ABC transporter ATP-binding protein [Mesorhizobium sp.]